MINLKKILLLILLIFLSGCKPPTTNIILIPIDNPQYNGSCNFNNWPYPDYNCSPGLALNVTAKDICYSGYSAKVRDVPESLKNKVYVKYGVLTRQPYEFEIDHIIPLSIGGSNDEQNLWPEAYNWTMGAREKDKVENLFHKRVCDGTMSLSDAQYQIVYNWTAWIK